MSRSGYSDDLDTWSLIRYRGAVNSAINGKRGQEFLKELLTALDALPVKELVDSALESNGQYCALGAVGKLRGYELESIDPYDMETCAGKFGIADAMAREIVFENDEGIWWNATPELRYKHMREWVLANLKSPQPAVSQPESNCPKG